MDLTYQAGGITNLNRYWNFAPELKIISGSGSAGFVEPEKAYQLARRDLLVEFTIAASARQPLANPGFIIGNWNITIQIA